MQNTVRKELVSQVLEDVAEYRRECEIVEIRPIRRDSLSENFNDELDAWARRALMSNGFGDF